MKHAKTIENNPPLRRSQSLMSGERQLASLGSDSEH